LDKPPPKKKKLVTKRKKFNLDFLKSFQTEKSCHSMPENIINSIPDVFQAVNHKQKKEEKKSESCQRKKFSLNKLMSFRNHKSCKSMPMEVINPICDILSPGLGLGAIPKQQTSVKRAKFSIDQLRKLQNKDEYKCLIILLMKFLRYYRLD